MAEPTVSVVIPAFNAQRHIEDSVKSALVQSDVDLEVIVIDDGSDDETADIVGRIAVRDSRVSVHTNRQNRGPASARNKGIRRARGRWIALLDGDDFFAPGRLRHLVGIAEAQGFDLLADNMTIVTEEGVPLGTAFGASNGGAVGTVTIKKFLEWNKPLAAGVKLGYVKPIMRREFLLRNGLTYKDDIRVGEDFLYYVDCLLSGGRFHVVPEALYSYRLSDDSITRSQDDAADRTRQLLDVNDALLEHEVVAGNQELRRLVAERSKEYEALLMYATLVGALRRRDVVGCVAEGVGNVRLVPGLLAVVAGALRRRIVVRRGGVSAFRGQQFGKDGEDER